MNEIEVKILNIARPTIEQKLQDLGATQVFDGELEAVFYDRPDNSLRQNHILLRLRTDGTKTYLTLKTPLPGKDVKAKEEHEVTVGDYGAMRQVLTLLGYKEWLQIKKHRTSYQLEDVHFEFDKHHGQFAFVPEYLELEAHDPQTIWAYVKVLGLRKEDCKPWSIWDIVKHEYPEQMQVLEQRPR
jgi:predicted adenylyl cyclase CyaB